MIKSLELNVINVELEPLFKVANKFHKMDKTKKKLSNALGNFIFDLDVYELELDNTCEDVALKYGINNVKSYKDLELLFYKDKYLN